MATATLKELSVEYAKKQPKMVDSITEKSPILDIIPFEKASHALWNVYEELTDVTAPGFVDLDEALPDVSITSDLQKQDLSIMGGKQEAGEDKCKAYGGRSKYFAKRKPIILKHAGMATEVAILYNNIRQYCLDNDLAIDAGSSGDADYSMLFCRFEEGVCGGLYSPEGFKNGAMLDILAINGGNLYLDSNSKLVYGIRYKGYFGFQILSTLNVHAICNINSSNVPTEAEIDLALANVRADEKTFIFCHKKCLNLLSTYKDDHLHILPADKNYRRAIIMWEDVPFVTSYNFLDGTEDSETI